MAIFSVQTLLLNIFYCFDKRYLGLTPTKQYLDLASQILDNIKLSDDNQLKVYVDLLKIYIQQQFREYYDPEFVIN